MRPMALASHQVLYIGTHQGRLQRVQLPSPGLPERWEQLWEKGRGEALMCLAVGPTAYDLSLSQQPGKQLHAGHYWSPAIARLSGGCSSI